MLSDSEMRRLARDVRVIKNQNLFPAALQLGCMGFVVMAVLGFFALGVIASLIGAIGHSFGW